MFTSEFYLVIFKKTNCVIIRYKYIYKKKRLGQETKKWRVKCFLYI